ncbi:MAG: hypothetical protein H7196_00285, partial [candidate division SR1 bacterium]|nr:hypothetical protein [candidate division SR1 bacterium]
MIETDAKYVSKYELEDLTGLSRSTISRKVFSLFDVNKEDEHFRRYLVDGKWMRKVDKEFALKLLFSNEKVLMEENQSDIADENSDIAESLNTVFMGQNSPAIADINSAIAENQSDIADVIIPITMGQTSSDIAENSPAIADINSDIAEYKARIEKLELRMDSIIAQNTVLIEKNNTLSSEIVDQNKRFEKFVDQFLETYTQQLTDSHQKNILLFNKSIENNTINRGQTSSDIAEKQSDIADLSSDIADENSDISESSNTFRMKQSMPDIAEKQSDIVDLSSDIADSTIKKKKRFW